MLRDPGGPQSFPPDEQHEVLGLACHPLTELAAARTHWALRPLAEAAGTWGYLRHPVSKSTVGRWLKRAALKPYRVRRWLHSPDPEFRRKVWRVVRLVSAAAPATILGDGHGALRPRARPGADHDAGVQPGEQRIWPRRLSERSKATT